MTDLATCSYAEFRPDMGVPVRISLGRHRGWSTPAFVTEITPRGWYLRRPEPEYVKAYSEQLARYGVEVIQARFNALAAEHGQPLVLCCFERLATGSWCHRTRFAEHWRQQTGQTIPELGQESRFVSPPRGIVIGGPAAVPPPVGELGALQAELPPDPSEGWQDPNDLAGQLGQEPPS